MSLQQRLITEETPSLPTSTPGQTEETARYDTEAVQRIVALAAQMQACHRETLSASDIEAVGREVGVEPEFIQRALAQVNAPTQNATLSGTVQVPEKTVLTRERVNALIPAALYVLVLLHYALSENRFSQLWIFVYVPAVLAICAGVAGRSKRRGALWGGLLGLMAVVTLYMPTTDMNRLEFFPWNGFLSQLIAWVSGGVFLGVSAATVAQFVHSFFPQNPTQPRRPRALRDRRPARPRRLRKT